MFVCIISRGKTGIWVNRREDGKKELWGKHSYRGRLFSSIIKTTASVTQLKILPHRKDGSVVIKR